ncbi:MAG: bis(5'-nucleosyl)-tetraphosphatase (symmetrical) YqeK [Elusimicrobiota bacterium]|nr:bis(5'-nucleosyl)-tetraphosphatase (symmetrical) YqeK [Elusimicrobiota bacterium]
MKTLVFGGSFDPPHEGHAALLAAAAERVRPQRILIVHAWRARLKDAAPAAPAAERLALVRLGVIDALPRRWRRRARLDAREARSARVVPTVETLSRLKKARPWEELHFVCGQDSAASFARWTAPARLRALAHWWYGARPGAASKPPRHFRRVPGRFPAVSSTALREALALGRDTPLLRKSVRARIEERGLYGGRLLRRLRATLKPGRVEHTLNVAALAAELARAHGADADKALLAGLLHDLGRRFPPHRLADYARRRRLPAPLRDRLIEREPMLLHAYASADIARRELGVTDPEVLSAVSKHTLGAGRMSTLDKVVYVADACSADRSHPGVSATRRLALRDLDAALRRCVKDKLAHARAREAWIHPVTLSLWKSLRPR